MIIGPNGTGKSSIACAIALGLNFPPAILGRASDLHLFVKQGASEGYIEIELKGPQRSKNLIIRRNLFAGKKTTTFTLNGESATGAEIKEKMTKLNVQVGNMCSFLPQDKVSEFAAMSPQQLLRETQRAAGDEKLTQWHDILIDQGKESRKLAQLMKDDQEQLKQMIERNEGIERDVQRFHERKRIEHEIALLDVLIPTELYRVMRERYMVSKEEQRKAHKKVMDLKAKNAPAHNLLKKFEAQHNQLDDSRNALKKSTQQKFKKMGEKWTESEKLETKAEDKTSELGQLKKLEKERINQIKSYEMQIGKLEAELAKPVVKLEKMQDLNDEARQINLEREDVVRRKYEVDQKNKELIERKTRAQMDLQAANNELQKLDQMDVRKMQNMQRENRDTHDAVLWLRANRHKFRMEVFEPPFLTVSVKDPRFANALEGCFSANQLRTFVAQCKEDVDTFNHAINDTNALGRHAKVPTWYRKPGDEMPIPLGREELHALGFDGYALDFIEYPQGMADFLRRELNLHRTPVALSPNIDVTRAMEAVSRPMGNHAGGATFINGTQMNIVNRSRYGRKAVSNMTRDINNARHFVAPPIDPEIKRRIDEAIKTSSQEIQMCNEEKTGVDEELAGIRAEDKEFEKRINDVKKRKDAIKAEEKRLALAKSKLGKIRSQLQDKLNAPSIVDKEAKLKKELLEISKKRRHIVREYIALTRAVINEQTEATTVGLQYLQIGANKAALQELCDKKDEKYQNAMAEFRRVDAEFSKIKADSVSVLAESKARINDAEPDIRDEYNTIRRVRIQYDKDVEEAEKNGQPLPSKEGVDLRSLDELQTELETQRTNLDLNLLTNPGVVEQYEKRKRDIEQLEKTIEGRQRSVDKIERQIKSARENWQPALEKLVASIGEKFSAAFDRIGCAGEIRISQHEDYEKWAIDILVKFRDSEKLQLLTGQRQSGGERSLTTILYLMSLTEEARAPFSLVDEINQGMDQRAERMVHNSMVEVTCKPDSAQYFLITPKLLPDLKYHERMKILCVNNGEWLPEAQQTSLGNMMNMIEGWVQNPARHAQGASAI